MWYNGDAANDPAAGKARTMNAKRQQGESKLTILYERLSVEDERSEESNSIKNQKALLEDYAERQGFLNTVHITEACDIL